MEKSAKFDIIETVKRILNGADFSDVSKTTKTKTTHEKKDEIIGMVKLKILPPETLKILKDQITSKIEAIGVSILLLKKKIGEMTKYLEEMSVEWIRVEKIFGVVQDYVSERYEMSESLKEFGVLRFRGLIEKCFDEGFIGMRKLLLSCVEEERRNEFWIGDGNKYENEGKWDVVLQSLCRLMNEKDFGEFVEEFVDSSRKFFNKEGAFCMENYEMLEYIGYFRHRKEREFNRIENLEYMRNRMEKVLFEALIDPFIDIVVSTKSNGMFNKYQDFSSSESKDYFKDWKIEDYFGMYEAFGQRDENISQILKKYITGMIKGQLKKAGGLKKKSVYKKTFDGDTSMNASENLLKITSRFGLTGKGENEEKIVKTEELSGVVGDAFIEILDEDVEKKEEYLSLFMDSLFRDEKWMSSELAYGPLFDIVVNNLLPKVEKFYFEKYYKIHLGKRLLSKRAISEEAEKCFVEKLRKRYERDELDVSNIEGMVNDISLNENKVKSNWRDCDSRKEFENSPEGFNLDVLVLTSGKWPIATHQELVLKIPPKIKEAMEIFREFYTKSESNPRRCYIVDFKELDDKIKEKGDPKTVLKENKTTPVKFTWKWSLGKAELQINGFDTRYIAKVTPFQMLILLCFNERKMLTFQEILDRTNIPQYKVINQMKVLISRSKSHNRLILKEKGSKKITPRTKFQFNDKFWSKRIIVTFPPILLNKPCVMR